MDLIVAADRNWGIGKDNGLLASLPTDMKYFKEHTMGKVVVMGRKTLESLPGKKGLPKRTNIVLTTNPDYEAERCTIVNSEDELFEEISKYDPDEVMLIGGGAMYNKYYKLCDRLYVTKMDAVLGADTFIENFDEDPDFEVESESEPITENGVTFKFVVYKKRH
jgi:dihydrofolate reductase